MIAVRPLPPASLALVLELEPRLASCDLVLYDAECRFCIAQVARLQRWVERRPSSGGFVAVPLSTPGLLGPLSILPDDARRALHLVTTPTTPGGSRIYQGLEAVVQLLRSRPLLGRLARLYYVPGLRQLGDLGYRLVARYRYLLMGRAVARGECDGACAIPSPSLERAAGRQVGDAGGGDAAR